MLPPFKELGVEDFAGIWKTKKRAILVHDLASLAAVAQVCPLLQANSHAARAEQRPPGHVLPA